MSRESWEVFASRAISEASAVAQLSARARELSEGLDASRRKAEVRDVPCPFPSLPFPRCEPATLQPLNRPLTPQPTLRHPLRHVSCYHQCARAWLPLLTCSICIFDTLIFSLFSSFFLFPILIFLIRQGFHHRKRRRRHQHPRPHQPWAA